MLTLVSPVNPQESPPPMDDDSFPDTSLAPSPFAQNTAHTLVALVGQRAGYIQVATPQPHQHYSALPPVLFQAAQAWCATLEQLGAPRIYWLTLSEQVRHLHIHLYPRWSDTETLRGTALFDQRNTTPQPPWQPHQQQALHLWAQHWNVALLQPPSSP